MSTPVMRLVRTMELEDTLTLMEMLMHVLDINGKMDASSQYMQIINVGGQPRVPAHIL